LYLIQEDEDENEDEDEGNANGIGLVCEWHRLIFCKRFIVNEQR
jgi:hypothetical protein